MSNKIIYRFTLNQPFDLIMNALSPFLNTLISYIEAKNMINFINVKAKLYYN